MLLNGQVLTANISKVEKQMSLPFRQLLKHHPSGDIHLRLAIQSFEKGH